MIDQLKALMDLDLNEHETLAVQTLLSVQYFLRTAEPKDIEWLRNASVGDLVFKVKS